MISQDAFDEKCGYEHTWSAAYLDNSDSLPCFAHRISVNEEVNTPALIKALIYYGGNKSHNDVLVFSVTEQDKCWKAWKEYDKAHPKTFKVVEGGSIHGEYMCRMYIYTKPVSKRKFGKLKGK
jgi:hypothetical protein